MNSFRLLFVNFLFSLIPLTRAFELKRCLLVFAGAKIGKDVRCVSSVRVVGDGMLEIGQGSWIGHNVSIFANHVAKVEIGSDVDVGPFVLFLTGSHEIGVSGSRRAGRGFSKSIKVGNGSWIGARSVILPGVSVGERSVIAAGSIVTRDVPANTLFAGNPAVLKRHLP